MSSFTHRKCLCRDRENKTTIEVVMDTSNVQRLGFVRDEFCLTFVERLSESSNYSSYNYRNGNESLV